MGSAYISDTSTRGFTSHADVYALAPVGIGVVDRATRVLTANAKYAELLGHTLEEIIGRRVCDLDPLGAENIARDFALLDDGGSVPNHQFVRNERMFQVSIAPYRDDTGALSAIIVTMAEITQEARMFRALAEANRELNDRATHDSLTGLYNRAYFEETLIREFKRTQRDGEAISLALLDVDYFKQYNDLYGHIAGDHCLTAVASAAQAALLRPGDVLSRYGGEELVAILADTGAEGASRTAERIRDAVAALQIPHARSPFGIVTVSVGVATAGSLADTRHHETRDQLVGAADHALYRAKEKGRNQVQLAPIGADKPDAAHQQQPEFARMAAS